MKQMLLLLFIFFSTSLYSQSKAETENWIKSKFDKWKVEYNEPNFTNDHMNQLYVETPLSLQFNECEMILKTSRRYQLSSGSSNLTYKIIIGDIDQLNWIDDSNLYISSRKANIKLTVNNSAVKYTKAIALSLNIYAENNLKDRFTKALNHLIGFCKPSIDEKEVF